jgi:class 3 adenylate cyclase/TolB-like protein
VTEQSERRLSAVFFADIVGFTALASKDEAAAMRLVNALQRLSKKVVEQTYHGRVVKFIGDAALAEFSSTDAAVRAAIALQEEYAREATAMGASPLLRTGVHLGEVIRSPDGDIYGDGVNTASRLQGEAEPGHIIVSEDVWRQLRPRTEFQFSSLGEVELRGIAARVAVFDVAVGNLETRAADSVAPVIDRARRAAPSRRKLSGRAFPWRLAAMVTAAAAVIVALAIGLPRLLNRRETPAPIAAGTTPLLAVIPFTAPDSLAKSFSDGLIEELQGVLGGSSSMMLASPEIVTPYVGQNGKDLVKLNREVGVTAVLQGTTRKSGNQVRVLAQLIDPKTGLNLWSETFNRDGQNEFDVHRELAGKIVAAIEKKLLGIETKPEQLAEVTPSVQQPPTATSEPANRDLKASSPSPRQQLQPNTQKQAQPRVDPRPQAEAPRTNPTPPPSQQTQRAADPPATRPDSTNRVQPEQRQPDRPVVPDPTPTQPAYNALADRTKASEELRSTVQTLLSAVAAGSNPQIKAVFPSVSDAQLTAFANERGAKGATVDLASFSVRRLEATAAEVFLVVLFKTGDPPVMKPVPYRAQLVHTGNAWKIDALAPR